MVILAAADVVVSWQRRSGARVFFFQAVESVLQDFAQSFEREIAVAQRPSGGVLQTLFRIMFLQAQDSQARAVALFGVGSALDDGLDQSSGVRAGLFGPADETGGTPFRIFVARG